MPPTYSAPDLAAEPAPEITLPAASTTGEANSPTPLAAAPVISTAVSIAAVATSPVVSNAVFATFPATFTVLDNGSVFGSVLFTKVFPLFDIVPDPP